jgi:hypothetical protein
VQSHPLQLGLPCYLKYAPVMPVAVVFVDKIVTNYGHVNVPLRCCFPKRDQHCYSRLLNLKTRHI